MDLNEKNKILKEAREVAFDADRQTILESSKIKSDVFATLIKNTPQASNTTMVKTKFDSIFAPLNEAVKSKKKLNEATNAASIATYDPVTVAMLKRTVVDSISYEVAGVQPLTQPTGLIFAYVPRYNSDSKEAFKNEPSTSYTGTGTHSGTNPADLNSNPVVDYTTGTGMTTASLEALNSTTDTWAQMKFTIEKTKVEAVGRGVRAEYTDEMVQDLKNVHGIDAGAIIADLLGREIVAEQNRQITRSIYISAKAGGSYGTTNQGIWSLDDDSKGRWVDENVKSLITQLNRDSASIFADIRMGRGNFGITTLNISDALAILPNFKPMSTQADGTTVLSGDFNGKKIIVDPYLPIESGREVFVSGFKGTTEFEAGIFFAPYIGLEYYQSMFPNTFQPTQGVKSRYGLCANPFATATDTALGNGTIAANTNQFFRRLQIKGSF